MVYTEKEIFEKIREAQRKVCDIIFELVASARTDLRLSLELHMLYNLNYCLRDAASMCRSNMCDIISEADDD